MSGLVGYDSADSDFDDGSSSKVTVMEWYSSREANSPVAKYPRVYHPAWKKVQNSAKTTGDLEAEWESFERLISGGGSPGQDDEGGKPIIGGVPCPSPRSESIFVGPAARLPFVEETQTSYGNSLAFQKATSNMGESSASDQSADSDMDVCSNSSEEKNDELADQPPPGKRQNTCSTSSSLKMIDAPNSDDDNSSSESDGSGELYHGKANVKQPSESEDSDDDEPHERQRSSSKSDSDHEDMDDLETLALNICSSSSLSNKSASPKTKSSVKETGERNPKSDKTRPNADKALETRETRSSSTDRLRTKLMALSKEKVRRSKSRSSSRERTNVKRRHHSPSALHRHVRDRDSHRRRRSKSRERRRRSRSREAHKRRHHSRSRSPRRRHRSRSGSRSRRRYHARHSGKPTRRSHERRRSGSRSRPKLTFKEQLRAQMLQAQQQKTEEISHDIAVIENKTLLTANEKKSALPLNSPNPLIALMSGAKDKVTPQQALMQTMAAVHAKAQEMTGVAVPSYYNPAAVNPIKYAEQLKKRKLLWSKNKEMKEPETDKDVENKAQWTSTSFAADNDGKMAAKFRKLMGIKEEDQLLVSDNVDISKLTEDQRKRQEELFMQLDREYAFARMTTHTHRGIGLGFQSQGLPDV